MILTFGLAAPLRDLSFDYDSDGATIDIGGKSAAFMPIREAAVKPISNLAEILEPGVEYTFQVIRDQDADGQVLLSIRQLQLKQLWEKLAEMAAAGTIVDTKVTGFQQRRRYR